MSRTVAHESQGMLNKVNRTDSSSAAEPIDEKTPTSIYLPRFVSSIQPRLEAQAADSARPALQSDDPGNSSTLASAEPSVIIAADPSNEYWCDGVADTVAVVRRRRSSALELALIATLGGLFAVSLGILLAEFTHCRCSMWWSNHPQSSAHRPSVPPLHSR
jgi:hypothetical protein